MTRSAQDKDGSRGIALHDVFRDFLRARLGPHELMRLNGILMDAVAATVPAVSSPLADDASAVPAWWQTAERDRYLSDHLIRHLIDAGRPAEAETAATDLRWVVARLKYKGPAAPIADLVQVRSAGALRLKARLAHLAHLLGRTNPPDAIVDILLNHLSGEPEWADQVTTLQAECHRTRLVTRQPITDRHPLSQEALSTAESLQAVTFSPDGTLLAAIGESGTVRIWTTDDWKLKNSVTIGHPLADAVVIAPDNSWFAVNGFGAEVWDIASARRIKKLGRNQSWVAGLAVNSTGDRIAISNNRNKVLAWNTRTWKREKILAGQAVRTLAFSPDGAWLAAAGSAGRIRIWDTGTWTLRKDLVRKDATEHLDDEIRSVAIAPDGTWFAAVDHDGEMRIWDTSEWTCSPSVATRQYSIDKVAISSSGAWLVAVAGSAKIFDTNSWEATRNFGARGGVRSAAFSPSSDRLALAGSGGIIRIWDLDRDDDEEFLPETNESVYSIAGALDGSWLASARLSDIQIMEATAWQSKKVLSDDVFLVTAMAVSSGGDWLVTVSHPEVRIWDTATWTSKVVKLGDLGHDMAVVISTEGTWLGIAGLGAGVRIWDTAAGTPTAIPAGSAYSTQELAVAPNGRWLATAGAGGVRIWDTSTWDCTRTIIKRYRSADKFNWVEAVAFSPDSSIFVTANMSGVVRIWNTATWTSKAISSDRIGPVRAVALSPDGIWLSAAYFGGEIRIWELASGQLQAMMRVDVELNDCVWVANRTVVLLGEASMFVLSLVVAAA